MVDKTAVAQLTAYGVAPSNIADALGVSSAYIYELIRDDESVRDMIKERAGEIAIRQHNNAVTMEQIEADMLTKLKAQIDLSDSLIETTKCLQLIKDIQAKGRAIDHGRGAEVGTTIDIDLGNAGANVKIQRNGSNEIISIAGRDMAPMPAYKVIQAVKERNGDGKDEEAKASYSVSNAPATDAL